MIIRSGKRILFHVGTAPFRSEFVGIRHFRKVLKRYPELSATVAHMGAYEYEEFFELLDMYPQLYMDTTYAFLPDIPMHYQLGPAYLETYKDRILYGSDFPNVIFPREVEIENLMDLRLSQEFYTKVFWENGLSLIREITHGNK
jgi:predicted TIM-barrel fold metal-dependent hydrolase